jgi:hypothetical protein
MPGGRPLQSQPLKSSHWEVGTAKIGRERMKAWALLVALVCLSSSVYSFADEPVCKKSEDGATTCTTENGDLYEVQHSLIVISCCTRACSL